jgi:muramidase (phage lysozyme)
MPTIIDALIVTLGIDASGVKKGSDIGKKGIKDVKKEAVELKDSFSDLKRGIGEFLVVLASTYAIKKFVVDITTAAATTGLLSKNLNISADDLNAWGNTAKRMGGDAASMIGTMKMLSASVTDIRMTGESGLLPYYRALGVNLADANGKALESNDILLQLSDKLKKLEASQGRETAYNIAKKMGLDEGSINLLFRGRKEIELTLQKQKQMQDMNKSFTEKSQKLRTAWADFGIAFVGVMMDITQAIQPVIKIVTDGLISAASWFHEHKAATIAIFTTLSFILGGVLVSAFASAAAAVWSFTAALLANPVTWVAAGVMALVAAIGLLLDDYQTWASGGKSAFDWDWLANGIKTVKEWISALVVGFGEFMASPIAAPIRVLIALFMLLGKGVWSLIQWIGKLEVAWLKWLAMDAVPSVFDGVIGKIKEIYDWIMKITEGWRNWLAEKSKPIVERIEKGVKVASAAAKIVAPVATEAAIKLVYFGKDVVEKVFKKAEGDYDSVNLGKSGGYRSGKRDLKNMTVGEVMQDQAAHKFNAAGRYQIIAPTLKDAAKAMGLTGAEKFDEALQDRIFSEYLIKTKRKAIFAYISGASNDIGKAMLAMSQEWASFADPRTGKSYYAGVGNNKASVSAAQSQQMLLQMRQNYQHQSIKNTTNNNSPRTSQVETHVGEVKIYTKATDANGIAADMKRAVAGAFTVNQAEYGLT